MIYIDSLESFYSYTYQLPMLGSAKTWEAELAHGSTLTSWKNVKYKTWNGDTMPLPTFSPPRHMKSLKPNLAHVREVPKSCKAIQI